MKSKALSVVHPFHRNCYDGWVASRTSSTSITSSRDRKIKCPTCNVASKRFTTVYIDLGYGERTCINSSLSNNKNYNKNQSYIQTHKSLLETKKSLDETTQKYNEAKTKLESKKRKHQITQLSFEISLSTISDQNQIIQKLEKELKSKKQGVAQSKVSISRLGQQVKEAKEEIRTFQNQRIFMRNTQDGIKIVEKEKESWEQSANYYKTLLELEKRRKDMSWSRDYLSMHAKRTLAHAKSEHEKTMEMRSKVEIAKKNYEETMKQNKPPSLKLKRRRIEM